MGMEGNEAADAAQFESGYAGTQSTATPTVVKDTVAPKDAKVPEVKEAPKAAPTPEPELTIKDVMARIDKYESSQNKLAGHIGGLQRSQNAINERLAAASAATKNVSDAPTQAQVKEAIQSPKEWEELKSEFPAWAMATEKFMDSKLANLTPAENTKAADIEKMVSERLVGQSAETRKQIVDMALDAVFPGWEDEVRTDGFGKWLESQAEDVKALAQSSRVGDAAKMLRLYEKSKQEPAQAEMKTPEPKPKDSAREKRFAAAVVPKGNGGNASNNSDVDEFMAGYNG